MFIFGILRINLAAVNTASIQQYLDSTQVQSICTAVGFGFALFRPTMEIHAYVIYVLHSALLTTVSGQIWFVT